MAYNQIKPWFTAVILHTKCKTVLKVVDHFKYLGAWMAISLKDFEVRKAIAWKACHKLKKIWKSTMNRKLKYGYSEPRSKQSYYMAVKHGQSLKRLKTK